MQLSSMMSKLFDFRQTNRRMIERKLNEHIALVKKELEIYEQ
jgi:hypothetical protein